MMTIFFQPFRPGLFFRHFLSKYIWQFEAKLSRKSKDACFLLIFFPKYDSRQNLHIILQTKETVPQSSIFWATSLALTTAKSVEKISLP